MAKIGTKANGIFYLDVTVPGEDGKPKRQRVSCDTRDRAEAEKQRKEWEIGVHPKHFSRGAVVAPKGRDTDGPASVRRKAPSGYTMKQLLDRCEMDDEVWGKARAQKTVRSNVKILIELVGDELVTDMTRQRLRDLADQLLAEGNKPGTVKRKMDALSKALRSAVELYEDEDGRPLLAAKPRMPEIKVRNNKNRVLQPAEEEAMFKAMDARQRTDPNRPWRRFQMFVRILIETGFRRGEGLLLGPASVIEIRDSDGVLRPALLLPEYLTKSEKPRLVPATPAASALFDELNRQAVDGLWFPKLHSRLIYMWDNLRDDVRALGHNIDDVSLHTLRHTCITRLALGGMELQRLSWWAGHSDVSITSKRYTHLSAQALLQGVAILSSPASDGNTEENPGNSAKRSHSVSRGNRAELGTVALQ